LDVVGLVEVELLGHIMVGEDLLVYLMVMVEHLTVMVEYLMVMVGYPTGVLLNLMDIHPGFGE